MQTDRYTLGDIRALEIANRLREANLVEIARVITTLGSLWVTAGLVLLAAGALASRRRWLASGALVAGMALTVALVHLVKAAQDRPRPLGPLVETESAAFPSGHAAYAVAWIAVTVALTRFVGGPVRATALVGAAVVVALAVGVTRVYLRAHFVSDVIAGVGVASAAFSGCALVAIVLSHQRSERSARIRARSA